MAGDRVGFVGEVKLLVRWRAGLPATFMSLSRRLPRNMLLLLQPPSGVHNTPVAGCLPAGACNPFPQYTRVSFVVS